MLVLSRRKNESYRIISPSGDVITVTQVEIRQSKSRVGIDAPDGYKILRDDLFDKTKQSVVECATT